MANANATTALPALGVFLCLTELVHGHPFERRGQVIGHILGLPGSVCATEFLLHQDDGDCEFYSVADVTITHIEHTA